VLTLSSADWEPPGTLKLRFELDLDFLDAGGSLAEVICTSPSVGRPRLDLDVNETRFVREAIAGRFVVNETKANAAKSFSRRHKDVNASDAVWRVNARIYVVARPPVNFLCELTISSCTLGRTGA
jgi:hypothetical protein